MKFYRYDEIKAAADCEAIAVAIGLKVVDHRCAATWRGGTNDTSVHISRDSWSDHGDGGKGGSVIDLVALAKFNGDHQQAQEWLGDHLGLTPRATLQRNPVANAGSHHERLIEQGYAEVARYDYTDAKGALVFQVVRMAHPEKGKEFLQQAASGAWTVKDLPKVLYNLRGIADAETVCVVEGEKDVETLRAWSIPATCNPGGAGKWLSEYRDYLTNRDVVILRDNDDAGLNHATIVSSMLAGYARSIRVINISKLPKGDVTDWRDQEGGTAEALLDLIQRTTPIDVARIGQDGAVAMAKEANKTPFRNFTAEWIKGKNTPDKTPRHVRDLVADIKTRFLGFPRKIGETLFDHDRDSNRIVFIESVPQLFGWIAEKSGQVVEWVGGSNMTPKDELYATVRSMAHRYEAVSIVPDWPARGDVYYAHGEIPPASEGFTYLNGLVDFFCPASPEDRCLIRALICAPIFYEHGIARPVWIIESEAPGAGKTTLAFIIGELYAHAPIEVKASDFRRDNQEITKRCVSPEGRLARILLIDNIVGTFACAELASMITASWITGRPSYGKNEESRPNNLTYVLTANNASIDNDLAIRAFTLALKALTSYDDAWNRRLRAYIAENRQRIFGDIIGMLNAHRPFEDVKPSTRFPEFETSILQPCCGDVEAYSAVVKRILTSRAEANIEEEWGNAVEDSFRHQLAGLGIHPDHSSVFIRSVVAERWIREAIPDMKFSSALQTVRNMARTGHCLRIHPRIRIWPHSGTGRRRGLLWLGDDRDSNPAYVVVPDGTTKALAKPAIGAGSEDDVADTGEDF